jgi:hypothetical protein
MPAVASAAVAEPDPVFAAIERYRSAAAKHNEVIDAEPARQSSKHVAWESAREEACDEQFLAFEEAMIETAPATSFGAVALMDFYLDACHGERKDHEISLEHVTALLTNIKGFVRARSGNGKAGAACAGLPPRGRRGRL